jgi:nicotinamide phosphoribosyltransferase
MPIPIAILTDSYKAGHYAQYPDALKTTAYGEFRKGFEGDKQDTRFVFYGIRYIVQNYLNHKWTVEDVELADAFYKTHNYGYQPFQYPRDLFLKFIAENNGYFPIKVEALLEGTVANAHVPVFQITAEQEYAKLCTFFETILTQVWYPTCVATLSRRTRELIDAAFRECADEADQGIAESRLHDFGFRGCTSVEQSVIGGCAHLLNFVGTDTMSAAYYAQYVLNNGRPIGQSLPATEHSVMTSWPTEESAIRNMIDHFGGEGKAFSVVMDSYDYDAALVEVLPRVAPFLKQKGGTMILRPDSGDPIEVVLAGLRAADACFGHRVNSKGYKVLNHSGVIQGDGINYDVVKRLLEEIKKAGYSPQSVAFGMGGGLLQKVNRDTMSFATKLSFIRYADGRAVDVMKRPRSDPNKISFPGLLKVTRVNGVPTIFPAEENAVDTDNLLKVVYDKGPVPHFKWDDFSTVRDRVQREWSQVPKSYDPISSELRAKIKAWHHNL